MLFIHGWTLSSAIWSGQSDWLASHGLRAIAYDRRGHGQSTRPETGYQYDILADDLATVLERLDLADVTLVGHSMGSGEIVRYFARHGAQRIARVLLVAPTTPFMLKTADNPDGTERQVYDKIVGALEANRRGYLVAGAPGLLGRNAEPELVEWAMAIAEQASVEAQIQCVRAFSETDFRHEMAAVIRPTLIVCGTADLPPIVASSRRSATAIVGSRLEIYQGAPHALFVTEMERFNRDLLQFLRSR